MRSDLGVAIRALVPSRRPEADAPVGLHELRPVLEHDAVGAAEQRQPAEADAEDGGRAALPPRHAPRSIDAQRKLAADVRGDERRWERRVGQRAASEPRTEAVLAGEDGDAQPAACAEAAHVGEPGAVAEGEAVARSDRGEREIAREAQLVQRHRRRDTRSGGIDAAAPPRLGAPKDGSAARVIAWGAGETNRGGGGGGGGHGGGGVGGGGRGGVRAIRDGRSRCSVGLEGARPAVERHGREKIGASGGSDVERRAGVLCRRRDAFHARGGGEPRGDEHVAEAAARRKGERGAVGEATPLGQEELVEVLQVWLEEDVVQGDADAGAAEAGTRRWLDGVGRQRVDWLDTPEAERLVRLVRELLAVEGDAQLVRAPAVEGAGQRAPDRVVGVDHAAVGSVAGGQRRRRAGVRAAAILAARRNEDGGGERLRVRGAARARLGLGDDAAHVGGATVQTSADEGELHASVGRPRGRHHQREAQRAVVGEDGATHVVDGDVVLPVERDRKGHVRAVCRAEVEGPSQRARDAGGGGGRDARDRISARGRRGVKGGGHRGVAEAAGVVRAEP